MRTSRTVSKALAIKIEGINTETRLRHVFEIVEFVPLDNDTKLTTKPGGATFHYCIEGEVNAVENTLKRLMTDVPVRNQLTEAQLVCL